MPNGRQISPPWLWPLIMRLTCFGTMPTLSGSWSITRSDLEVAFQLIWLGRQRPSRASSRPTRVTPLTSTTWLLRSLSGLDRTVRCSRSVFWHVYQSWLPKTA